jgi:hypothetical protein
MSVYALLVLRTVMVANALLLLAVGGLLAWFMEHPAGWVFGAVCWFGAGLVFGGVRYVDRLYERGR